MVPQAAQAITFASGPPCDVTSLKGGFGYELFGVSPSALVVNGIPILAAQVGRWYFNGDGTLTDIFTNNFIGFQYNTQEASQGTYTISSDCTTVQLIVHGEWAAYSFAFGPIGSLLCVHITANITPTGVALGSLVYGKGLPTVSPSALPADASLTCTDQVNEIFHGGIPPLVPGGKPIPPGYFSTFTGSMTQQ